MNISMVWQVRGPFSLIINIYYSSSQRILKKKNPSKFHTPETLVVKEDREYRTYTNKVYRLMKQSYKITVILIK